MGEFADKVVLVTGAGRGTGRAIAEAFAAQGATVAANDITPVNLDETIRSIRASGGRANSYVFDIAAKMPAQAMISQILDDWGRIDILVNNAAVQPRSPLLDMDEWDWRRTIDVNLAGPFFTMQSVGRVMREQGGGVIVNIAAVMGPVDRYKDRAAYAASKAGLIGLTRAAAQELAVFNIRVNALCPGAITAEAGASPANPAEEKDLADIAREVAGMVLFLASEAAADLTGQAINVDGSRVMW